MDDIITKSKELMDHVKHLEETLELLKKYQMKLNPEKCVFGVSAGKFLGFLVSQPRDRGQLEKNMGSSRNEVPLNS